MSKKNKPEKSSPKNPFSGNSLEADFCRLIYKRVKERVPYTLEEILKEYLGVEELPKNKKTIEKNNELIKEYSYKTLYSKRNAANAKLREWLPDIKNITGKKTQGAVFQYCGEEDNPLKVFEEFTIKKNLKNYWEFCQDSSDLLPETWFRHFFKHTTDLLSLKKRRRNGKQIIFSSASRELKNVELLPLLYEYIKEEKVLCIKYKTYDGKEKLHKQFHPQCLKQYNERWFLYGYKNVLAIDRIESVTVVEDAQYQSKGKDEYINFFNQRVGGGGPLGGFEDEVISIRIRVYTPYIYGLISSKPIHASQKPIGEYKDDEGYGEFDLSVVPNRELIAQILLWGEDVEIISPDNVREYMKKKVMALSGRYLSEI